MDTAPVPPPAPAVAGYYEALPEPARTTLLSVRAAVLAAAPDAKEVMTYGMPGFRVATGLLAGLRAAARHAAYYPMSGTVVDTLADALASLDTAKGTVRFSLDAPLPADRVAQLVAARRAELAGNGT